jgi:hypothetical protein
MRTGSLRAAMALAAFPVAACLSGRVLTPRGARIARAFRLSASGGGGAVGVRPRFGRSDGRDVTFAAPQP